MVVWKLTNGGNRNILFIFENLIFVIMMLLVSYVFMRTLLELYSSFEEYTYLVIDVLQSIVFFINVQWEMNL